MSSVPPDERSADAAEELLPEYRFDYGKARPNRFAMSYLPGGRLILLDPDVAPVFTTDGAVNSALRALIATMPSPASR